MRVVICYTIMSARKLTASETVGSEIKRIVCTYPPATYYGRDATFLLHLHGDRLLTIGFATCRMATLAEAGGGPLYPAVAYNHKRYLEPDALAALVVSQRIRRLIRTETVGYDQTMIVLSNDVVLGNCEMGDRRALFLRSRFDEKRESETPYWDYFTNQPVDHLGFNCSGETRMPFRVGWV